MPTNLLCSETDSGTLSVMIPVHNEERTIGTVLRKVLLLGGLIKEIIVVDDASRDETVAIIEEEMHNDGRIRLFRHDTNQGKTAAIRTALQHVRGEILIVQDADLEYDPEDIPDVISPILKGQADVVYGSRFLRRKDSRVQYLMHYLANIGLTRFSNLFTGRRMSDMETCYKAFRAGVLKPLRITSRGFGMEVEITALMSRTRARTFEVPISYHGRSYKEGKKIRFRDGVMAGFYILWYNLVAPWFPATRVYVATVNEYLRKEPSLQIPQQEQVSELQAA